MYLVWCLICIYNTCGIFLKIKQMSILFKISLILELRIYLWHKALWLWKCGFSVFQNGLCVSPHIILIKKLQRQVGKQHFHFLISPHKYLISNCRLTSFFLYEKIEKYKKLYPPSSSDVPLAKMMHSLMANKSTFSHYICAPRQTTYFETLLTLRMVLQYHSKVFTIIINSI